MVKVLIFLNEKSKPNGDLTRICLINKVNLVLIRYRFFKTYFQSLIEPKIIIKIIKIFPHVISHPPLFLFPFPFLFLPCQVIKIIICTVEKESFNFTYILMSYQHSYLIYIVLILHILLCTFSLDVKYCHQNVPKLMLASSNQVVSFHLTF